MAARGHLSLHEAVKQEDVEMVKRLLRDKVDVSLQDKGGWERTPLHLACAKGNLELIEILVSFGADCSIKDMYGDTPLTLAANEKHYGCVIAMIEKFGCDPNIKGSHGRTVLHFACGDGKIDLIHVVQYKSNFNVMDNFNDTPLMIAAKNKQYEVVKLLILDYGCNQCFNGRTLLHFACANGNIDLVHVLIQDCKADLNKRDHSNDTPLMIAAKSKQYEIVKSLVHDYGCDPNVSGSHGKTPLHYACADGNIDLVHLLVQGHKADLNIKDHSNDTPLMAAAKNRQCNVINSLVHDYGCDPNVKDSYGKTLLHLACANGDMDLIHVLLRDCKADVNIRDNSKSTPLMKAANKKHYKVWESLVCDYGCDPNVTSSNGRTLLHFACANGNIDLVHILIRGCKADLNISDESKNTPLMTAAKEGQCEIVKSLVNDYGCDPNKKDHNGRTLLHFACADSNIDLMHLLAQDCKADLNVRDKSKDTPLMIAAKEGQFEMLKSLVNDYGCDPNVKDDNGRTLLHFACINCDTGLVNVLVRDCKADLNIRDKSKDTPLMIAARESPKVWESLVCDHGCDPNFKDPNGKTPLHFACANGDNELVHVLVNDCKADINITDYSNNTPFMAAVKNKQYAVWQSLVCNYGCDPNVKGADGRTLLHCACANGQIDLVHILVRDCKANLNIGDNSGDTPFVTAAKNERYEVVKSLVCDYGYDPDMYVAKNGKTLLHLACADGNVDLVHMLVQDCKANLGTTDYYNNSPLMLAAKNNQCEVVKSLVCEYGCNPNEKDIMGYTPLHNACASGNIDVVHVLLQDCKADLRVRDNHASSPLFTAVRNNKHEVVKVLISQYKFSINETDNEGRSLLHVARSISILRVLIDQFKLSPLLSDNDGNTPLHLFSCDSDKYYDSECVSTLLFEFHVPVYIRNKAGQTPRDICTSGKTLSIFEEYLSTHGKVVEADYQSMQLLAEKRYSGSNFISRIFVVGHPGAGKSSLVETLKREEFFESFSRVSEKSVPPHTAGIVPSVFTSKGYGRVQFYDFAGDPEYYSSHAAILERISQSSVGTNICLVVLNLVEKDSEIRQKYLYWLSFIRYSFKGLKEPPSIIVIGSHSDKLRSNDVGRKNSYIRHLISKECVYFSLDCCSARSGSIKLLRQKIYSLSRKSQPYSLSHEESILLGFLEKDFRNVTACTAETIASSIEELHLSLPKSVPLLYPILQQLQALGILFIVGNEEGSHIILNVAQLTNEVHKKLFSIDAFSNSQKLASFNIGLLPESLLQEVLPKYITKECLIQLQYCQETSHIEVDSNHYVFPSSDAHSSLDKSLFFPALCSIDKDISWLKLEHSYSIGWFARCSDSHDFFPPRFLHVLLLRIALRFTLVVASFGDYDVSPDHMHFKRRCKMWKTGVHWLLEDGVECEVDVIDSKGVVVSIQSNENSKVCLTIFNNIVSCVMEAKAEFCDFITLEFFLLDRVSCLNDSNLFSMLDVERTLKERKPNIVSLSGDHLLSSSKLVHVHSTYWDSLFPINEHSILEYINVKTIGDRLIPLGTSLDIDHHILRGIEHDNLRDIKGSIKGMVCEWLCSSLAHSSSHDCQPPCWWRLVEALKEIGMNKLASDITQDKGEHIALQEKLLDPLRRYFTPDEEFLEPFAAVVGFKWPYLASLLSLTSSTIEEVRREGEGLSQRDRALLMLHKWVSKGEATYDQLYEKLKPVSLFNYH